MSDITYLHSTPSPPPKTPIVIRQGRFCATLYDVPSLMDFTPANLRKLWKLMFEDGYENAEAIGIIREWLPRAVADTEAAAQDAWECCKHALKDAEAARSTVAAFGSVATKEQQNALKAAGARHKRAQKGAKAAKAKFERAKKLQSIFNEMAEKARF